MKQVRLLINICTLLITTLLGAQLYAQSLPNEAYLTADERMLITGGMPSEGLYDLNTMRQINLEFDASNYWTLLDNNWEDKINILADMTVDGELYEDVGVRFRGNTSYFMSGVKKSFSITVDFTDPDQKLMGYETLNLGNLWQDESFMREVYTYETIKEHTPTAKVNYVRLSLNGEDWGVYASTQQLDGDFMKDWFLSNDGTRWRADSESGGPGGPGGPPGGGWGDGTAAVNWLGPDTADYQEYYTLKKTSKENAWEDLVNTCDVLENTPLATLPANLPDYLDVDRTLWFLATENLFADDDSYIHKGKMDYYLYWEPETNRMTPLEYDANSVLSGSNVNWSVFENASDPNYPLLYQMLAVPEYRQRYLAHMRTLIDEYFDPAVANAKVDELAALIDPEISTDPKIPFTYSQFLADVSDLKNKIATRKSNLESNSEVAQVGPTISALSYESAAGEWMPPVAGEDANVTASISSATGISLVYLYHSTEIVGNFLRSEMYDDGAHNDGAAGDGVYGAAVPGYPTGTPVRFYVEAAANNTAKSVSYAPPGAEHDVYFYQVKITQAANVPVVINEVMAANSSTATDDFSEYDDWIELYNVSSSPVDLSGFILTDNIFNLDKWTIAAGTIIEADDYLIIWADEDGSQGDSHANFKLASAGESVLLLDPSGELHDRVDFGAQETDLGYARIPNGTGEFIIQAPSFGYNNENATSIEEVELLAAQLSVFPSPANEQLLVSVTEADHTSRELSVFNAFGQLMTSFNLRDQVEIAVANWPAGIYYLQSVEGESKSFVVAH